MDQSSGDAQRSEDGDKNEKFNVTKAKLKQENEGFRRKLSEISWPKRRRTVHKIMLKYYRDPFWTPIDIAKKILRKLKIHSTGYYIGRIRQDMDTWMSENVTDYDSDEESTDDSSKKNPKDIEEQKKNNVAIGGEDGKRKSSNTEALLESEPAEKKKIESNIKTNVEETVNNSLIVKKEVPLIDLTSDLKNEVKKEVITIDEDVPNVSDKIIVTPVNGNSTFIPYPVMGYNSAMPLYYPQGFYQQPYCRNYDSNIPFFSPIILPYGCQYPYNPYYSQPYNSDLLPEFPIDCDSRTVQPSDKDSCEQKDTKTEGSQTAKGLDNGQ